MRLWKIDGGDLKPVAPHSPRSEGTLEGWVEKTPSMLGLDIMIIARQCVTDFGGRIDLLGIDREGTLTLIELKRDRTARDVVAQTLDYASWINSLTPKRVNEVATAYLGKPLYLAFEERFGISLPDTLNISPNMIIVAGDFDASSKRIVEYLAEQYGVSINTAFFNYFKDGDIEYLAADWLMDQEQVVERAEAKAKAPWTGYFYVNAGHDPDNRNWEDMREFGFIAAGYGRVYSSQLNRLSPDNQIFVYQPGAGYIGYGIVSHPAVMAKDFVASEGKKLSVLALRQPNILHDEDDPEKADYVVRVIWKKTVPIEEAKWLDGGFSNPNVVCKLREPFTLKFLTEEFGVDQPEQG